MQPLQEARLPTRDELRLLERTDWLFGWLKTALTHSSLTFFRVFLGCSEKGRALPVPVAMDWQHGGKIETVRLVPALMQSWL